MPDLERSVSIAAEPERVYALVSDLPRMGEWSPECTRVGWTGGATGPAPGARFVGHNRAGAARWLTQGVITMADPGRRFAFDIHFGPIQVSRWEYVVEAAPGGGCILTELWTDRRPALLRATADRIFGPRHQLNAHGIEQTLANVKAAAEAEQRA
jgi:uncharacterized protein YndB with AHSA1/START domain